ncbi:MMPL family transporter [Aestuariicella hydrocarbonica]|uniref:MMPL family transporter n=1 Tax=Pseudomaricurvus hydrocarbonicus TaxID=1470433 RepID=A0A9E5JS87_9GAMM|nr:MMPL family transporter [Aestuariicella hydrocarbonica]NHO64588.1 MMPL family transporter [Aestuariicella hydrocarbonica]
MDYGIFVLANHRFVEKLGYDHFEQLESSNLLDHTVELDKAALREFLTQASHSDAIQKHLPQLSVNFRSADGHIFAAELSGYCTHLEGKDVIEIQMVTEEDRKLANRVRNLPWRLYLCLICLLAITVLPNAILPKLNINNAPTTFLPPDALSRQFYDHVRTIFPDDEVIILLFEGVALFSDGFLQAYDQLGFEIGNLEDVDDVIAITSQDHIEGTDEGFLISPLVDIEQLDETRPQERLQRAIGDRFARNSLVAADGSAIAMVVIPVNLDNSILNLKLEESILQRVKEQQLDGYLRAVSGEITTDVAQMRMILQDNMTFIPLTVATGLLLTWLLFHRMLAVVITGVVTGAVVNSTTSLFVLFDQPFNSISSILPPLLSALTMAALVHVYNALQYTSLRGLNGRERVNAAMQEVKRPALFSALTTAIGLASLGFSSIPPIRMFGLSAALGVCLVYLIVIHLLPPILVQFDRKPWPRRQHGLQFLDQLVNVLVRTGIRHPVTVIAVVVLSLAASAPLIARIKVETNLLEFFHADHPLRVDTAHIENKLAGTLPLEIVFTATDPDWLLKPAILQQIRQLQTGLESLTSVDKTLSVADFIEEMNWGFHAEDPKYRTIPDDAQLISQYLFVYDGEDLFDFIDSDYLNARVAISANVHGAEEIRQLIQDVREQLRKRPGLLGADIKWEISGAGRLFADQEALLIEGQGKSLGGALVLIFLLLLASWRSLRDAALCMIPNLSPILLIFIVMGLLRINLDMATAMIASVAVGIAIDDTIHVYHGFIHRIKAGRSPVTALVRAYQTAGRAVMVTTFILCSQFLLLLASAFVPMGYFGLLSSIGLIAALVFDLLLLPAILILVFSYFPYKKKRSRHHKKHVEQFDDTL